MSQRIEGTPKKVLFFELGSKSFDSSDQQEVMRAYTDFDLEALPSATFM
jgi:hypothetical protein